MGEIVTTIIDSLTSFVGGMGESFLTAFRTIFMNETETGVWDGLNELGVFILVFVGISFGYGIIRWITGLFRRQG